MDIVCRATVLSALCAISACAPDAPENNACADAPKGQISVERAWLRPAPTGGTSALYAVICNRTAKADALTSVEYADAGAVELHETQRSADGVVSMSKIDRLTLPAGAAGMLSPGGVHAMLINLAGPIEEGGEREVVLRFEDTPALLIRAAVQRREHAH